MRIHPGGNPGANLKSISHKCHLFEVAFVWELTKETIHASRAVESCWAGVRHERWQRRVDVIRGPSGNLLLLYYSQLSDTTVSGP